jgi:hypothetical protein
VTEVTSVVIVRMKHIRMAALCADGTRGWWIANRLDWRDFVKNGIEADRLAATGDPFAIRVAEIARDDHGR